MALKFSFKLDLNPGPSLLKPKLRSDLKGHSGTELHIFLVQLESIVSSTDVHLPVHSCFPKLLNVIFSKQPIWMQSGTAVHRTGVTKLSTLWVRTQAVKDQGHTRPKIDLDGGIVETLF